MRSLALLWRSLVERRRLEMYGHPVSIAGVNVTWYSTIPSQLRDQHKLPSSSESGRSSHRLAMPRGSEERQDHRGCVDAPSVRSDFVVVVVSWLQCVPGGITMHMRQMSNATRHRVRRWVTSSCFRRANGVTAVQLSTSLPRRERIIRQLSLAFLVRVLRSTSGDFFAVKSITNECHSP